jgi:hypothetical protein
MFKKIALLVVAAFIVGLFVVPIASAGCQDNPDPAGCCQADPDLCKSQVSTQVQNGKMKMLGKWTRVYLYEKDPETWDAIGRGGAFGFLDYRLQGTVFKFLFVGKKLEPGFNYTLIYYPDPWPGNGLICLGSGTADELGKVKIVGKGDPLNPFYAEPQSTGNLPATGDENPTMWIVTAPLHT